MLMLRLGIQWEGRIHQGNMGQSMLEIFGQFASARVVFLRQQTNLIS